MTSSSQVQSTVRRVLDDKRDLAGALLPIHHDIPHAPGHVPPRTRLQ